MSDIKIELDQLDDVSRLRVSRDGAPLTLSRMLPVLSAMGIEVLDETVTQPGSASWTYDLGIRLPRAVAEPDLLADALAAAWDGRTENDGFSALVVTAGLTWREVFLLRALVRFLRLGASSFAQETFVDAVTRNVDLARLLVRLFEARFDPATETSAREQRTAELEGRIFAALDDVASLDHDRILRSMFTVVSATVRTSWFQRDATGERLPYLSMKLQSNRIPDLPQPRPEREIFVYSPRFEAVHLRFGPVARGGLRWSDRRDDFRTEVLGLVKAQTVKNAVIVPVGAKGGFYCKQLPDPGLRDEWMAEGRACYRLFVEAMLGLTDNLTADGVVPPQDVVRHDDDDAYLVVAADKGTATFSDLANEVAAERGFWLGDAFASGGSHGYDHKALGITARGAWESAKRHLRELGIDSQTHDFTVVGVGDMSGDVFGNGMLQSEHIRLVAAFDHRDIFVDPHPDAATSYAERKRLFGLSRSSWRDYDPSQISEGGGVFSRAAKSIPVSPQMRSALALASDTATMTPAELMHAILKAPVDLFFNGGIGTYVKAETETHADVSDKANDSIRVNGGDMRTRVVVEGGNLGLTQRGRIEYARFGDGVHGGRVTADFIDNSAGVDTSDHEVNIKILLSGTGIDLAERDALLEEMADEVAAQVIRDNYQQNVALACVVSQAASLLHVHSDWIDALEHAGLLDRELEALPTHKQFADRKVAGEGLSQPELAVLLSYTKIALAEELSGTDVPDDAFTTSYLTSYFPSAVRTRFADAIARHPLRRELIVTQVVNDLVNTGDMTYIHRLTEETGVSTADLVRANVAARQIFGAAGWFDAVEALDGQVDPAVLLSLRLDMRTLTERASRWLALYRRRPLDVVETVVWFSGVSRLIDALPMLLSGAELAAYERRRDEYVAKGVPAELASHAAVFPPAYAALDSVETARREQLDPIEVARMHFALGGRLGLPALVQRILVLPRPDRWHSMARAALREDLHNVHGQLTAEVLSSTDKRGSIEERLAQWESGDVTAIARTVSILSEVTGSDAPDLAPLSVCVREVRTLLSTS